MHMVKALRLVDMESLSMREGLEPDLLKDENN